MLCGKLIQKKNIVKKNKIKKILDKISKKEFAGYLLVGSSSVLIDLLLLSFLKECLNFSPVLSVVLNQIVIYNYVFFLNKFFVFKIRDDFLRQAIRYCQLAFFNYLIAIAWMWFFAVFLHENYLIVRIANILFATTWNFILYRFFVYKKRSY